MSVITVFNALYCNEEAIIRGLVTETGYRRVDDPEVIARAASLSGLSTDRVGRAFAAKASLFNPFTHEKEKSVAYLRLAVAEILGEGKLVLTGFSSHLVPAAIAHVLRICLVAEMSHRLRQAESGPAPDKDANKAIHRSDDTAAPGPCSSTARPTPGTRCSTTSSSPPTRSPPRRAST